MDCFTFVCVHFMVADNVSFEDAASMPLVFHTTWQGLVNRAGIKKGDRLLVLGGAGGTGVFVTLAPVSTAHDASARAPFVSVARLLLLDWFQHISALILGSY